MKYIYTIICLLMLMQAQATVKYVKITNFPGNGNSWATAYNDLQTTLNNVVAGDEVWVGQGTYLPTVNTSFSVKPGVKVYGGFNPTNNGVGFNARNWKLYPTILKGSGTAGVVYYEANSSASLPTTLEGFIITNGYSYTGSGITVSGSIATTNSVIQNMIIKNCTAISGGYGGGAIVYDATVTFNNVVFKDNEAGYGGGIYIDHASARFNNVVFDHNDAVYDGGGVSILNNNQDNIPSTFNNVVFYDNFTEAGVGGGVFANTSTPSFNNCSFVKNFSKISAGGGLHTYSPANTAPLPVSIVTNCVFWNNTATTSQVLKDIDVLRGNSTVTYSYFKETSTYSSTTNITSTTDPFTASSNPTATDTGWLNNSNGLIPSLCSKVIDAGNSNANALTTDLAGQIRKWDVDLVPDAGTGSPAIDMGAYENQNAATSVQLAGVIGNAHMVPNPQELKTDSISNVVAPSIPVLRWEKSTNNVNWTPTTPAGTLNFFRFSDSAAAINLITPTYYRRVSSSSSYCNLPIATNSVLINVVVPNGSITGQVTSRNGNVGIPGINIRVTRTGRTPISGADPNEVYTATTDGGGYYTVSKIYYGDPDQSSSAKDTFRIVPGKINHLFTPSVFSGKELTSSAPQPNTSPVHFKDTTILTVTGTVSQRCDNCTASGGFTIQVQTCPIDSVKITSGNYQFLTQNILGSHGNYTLPITDPGQISITPAFRNHQFDSAFRSFYLSESVQGINFRDTTTHVLSGFVTAGCNNYLGQVVIEFTDVLPSPQSSCFRKRLMVNAATGFYTVRLPAGKYKAEVIDLISPVIVNSNNPAYVSLDDLKSYFNTLLPRDSVTRDITTRDTTLNLTYLRRPVISITQRLDTLCAPGMPRGFAIFQQGIVDSFRVKVFQGPDSLNCPITDTTQKIKLYTSIDTVDNIGRLHSYNPSATGTWIKLKGGTPFIVSPYYKVFYMQFADKYGRSTAQLYKNVVVTGVRADTATFTTVSPEIPLLILHDPPGDGSNSTWSSTKSISSALRFYTADGDEEGGWLQAKIGAKFEAGIGVSTESEVWGTLNGGVSVNSSHSSSDETVTTLSTTTTFSTSGNPAVIGQSGDVYVGAALNLIYAGATEVIYDSCRISTIRKLIVADQGFATKYIYSESQIKDVVIPTQMALSRNPGNTAAQTAYYLNQASVWQQVLDNNADQKSKASFVENLTFDGSSGPAGSSSTLSISSTNTVEFNMTINETLALELGFEIAGSGVSGGVNVAFKTETGKTTTNTTAQETTIAYVITDDDPGDYYSVNVKKDPVYGTPVFDLVAGTSSCPAEPGTQHRDDMEIYAPVPVQSNIPANDTAYFLLYLANTSQSAQDRTYRVSFDQSTNTGVAVSIGGSQAGTPVPYSVAYGAQVPILVGIKRLTNYSFEGLRFIATDDCGGSVSKSVTISANFANSCTGVTMSSPENGWFANSGNGNIIPIHATGYTKANVQSIAIQYAKAGTSNWVTGFTQNGSYLNSDATSGTDLPWDITYVQDTAYNIRLKFSCGTTDVYSQRASGVIDRRAPILLGRPEPTDDNYVNGDVISYTYDEKLNTGNLNNGRVIMTRLSNGANLPVTVTGYENRIVIVPNSSINGYIGETIRVVVTGMSDLLGNVKSAPDTSYFLVGSSTVATGAGAITVGITNPVVYKNSDSTINVFFKLPVTRNDRLTRVNYTATGTARLGVDYTISYGRTQPAYTYFNGSEGAISIGRDSLSTVLRIKPIGDTGLTADKTIVINITEGGDYGLGATTTVTGKISSEDSVATYTFIGDGYFNTRSNWLNGKMPLTTLISGKQIIINPSGTCILNVPQKIKQGGTFTVKQNKNFIIQGSLKLQ